MFVALNSSGYTSTSTNADTWTTPILQSGLSGASQWYNLACNLSNHQMVAVSYSSYVATTKITKVISSSNNISGSDVINALGYTPYNSSNPNGYTSNVGTVTKVNNTSPDANGNVTISMPEDKLFVATYNSTSFSAIQTAYSNGKQIVLKDTSGNNVYYIPLFSRVVSVSNVNNIVFEFANCRGNHIFEYTCTTTDGGSTYTWSMTTNNLVTTDTVQTITSAKNIYGVDAGASGQNNLLAVISNNNGTTGQWVGRMTVGAKNKTFIMGTYNNMCIIGAHSWTNAQEGTGAAWEHVYLNSDGNQSVFIGGSGNTANSGWFKVDNSTGKSYVNRGTIASPNWVEVGDVTSSSLTQVQCVVETYTNGTSWYRVWSDGWCEQGGRASTGAVTSYTISLLKTMANTNYNAQISNLWIGDDTGGVGDYCLISGTANYGKSTTTLRVSTISNANYALDWMVCGYIY